MHGLSWLSVLLVQVFAMAGSLSAQMPFYTDNPDVTDRGTLHFEFYNEYDALQSFQYPDLRQNTANLKVNFGLPHSLELDFDIPYLAIYRAPGSPTSSGFGDTDMGIKWNLRNSPRPFSPAFGGSLYIEFPTGDKHQQLSSGLADYWLNFIVQEPFSDKTRLTGNAGYLFAGNTSTGVLGIQTTRGHVFTGGLSLLHDFNPRLTLGGEIYGGVAATSGLDKNQLQGLGGGQYTVRNGLSFSFALLGGKYAASPKVGGQVGFAVDLPGVLRSAASKQSSSAF